MQKKFSKNTFFQRTVSSANSIIGLPFKLFQSKNFELLINLFREINLF